MEFPITRTSDNQANQWYDAHRFMLDIGFGDFKPHIFALGFFRRIRWRETQKWEYGGRYFYIGLRTIFEFGSTHLYYDGPHCSFSFGFLNISWSWNWCKKCAAELDENHEQ